MIKRRDRAGRCAVPRASPPGRPGGPKAARGAWQVELDDAERARLRRVGYWRSEAEPELPDPRQHVDPRWEADERRAALAYLGEAPACASWMGYSTCRLCGRTGGELGDSDLTDGTWIWPEGLAHYVEHHDVRLPEPFLAHLRARRFALGAIVAAETTVARLADGQLADMTRSDDAERISFQLARPATESDAFLGVEIDRARGCYRTIVNPAALERARLARERMLHPSWWRRLVRAILG